MKRINLLDLETSNKIAAGEVVERPASVVKELIENSIDANAKSIQIEIVEGGEKLIKIIDDGSGIHPEDIEKAFLPHATSKIEKIEDIYKIQTMGFRGEALASISAVSNVKMVSRTIDAIHGKEIRISGGSIEYINESPSNVGTTIEVENLFYNVPARLKFLKSPVREASIITDIVEKIALSHSEIAFKLTSNNKKVFQSYGTSKTEEVIRTVYGKNTFENVSCFEKHIDLGSIYGFIGNAELCRGSRNNQSIFINKRFVKSKLITAAVEGAYKSFLTINKFPFFVLFLDIYPELVDVNVHPTKSEVKFKDEREIFKIIFDAVHSNLRKLYQSSVDYDDSFKTEILEEKGKIIKEEVKTVQLPLDLKNTSFLDYKKEEIGNNTICEQKENEFKLAPKEEEGLIEQNYKIEKEEKLTFKNTEALAEKNKEEEKEYKLPSLNIIGQLMSTYILAEGYEGMYIIDQHAAHEKVIFERYIREIEQSEVLSQILLSPVILELSSEDYLYFIENKNIFQKAGFSIEEFGEKTIAIKEVPIVLGKPDMKNLFIQILDNLKNLGNGKTSEVKYDKIAKLSCKSAVKAKDSLSMEEMKALLNSLGYSENPFTCPHGRPTIIKLTMNEIEKRFKRIQ